LYLWDKPHYRALSFAHDLRANLSNVAVPGTGVPLSTFCHFKVIGFLAIFVLNPLLCFLGAVNVARTQSGVGAFCRELGKAYRKQCVASATVARLRTPDLTPRHSPPLDPPPVSHLASLLFPDDWFSYWRLNCSLASFYWLVTKEEGYELENKWTFLRRCMEKGVPCSPCDTKVKGLCIKHKNEEGGLGIHFYRNATQGGDWIIQVGRACARSFLTGAALRRAQQTLSSVC